MTQPASAVLPYPRKLTLDVYRDDARWSQYPDWFRRPSQQLNELFVARITLAHRLDSNEPDYSYAEWCEKSARLIAEYPDCVFVY